MANCNSLAEEYRPIESMIEKIVGGENGEDERHLDLNLGRNANSCASRTALMYWVIEKYNRIVKCKLFIYIITVF